MRKYIISVVLSLILVFAFSTVAFAYSPGPGYQDIEFLYYYDLSKSGSNNNVTGLNITRIPGGSNLQRYFFQAPNADVNNPQGIVDYIQSITGSPYYTRPGNIFDGYLETGVQLNYDYSGNAVATSWNSLSLKVNAPLVDWSIYGISGSYSILAGINPRPTNFGLAFSFDDNSLKGLNVPYPTNGQTGVLYNLPVVPVVGIKRLDSVSLIYSGNYGNYGLGALYLLGDDVTPPVPPVPPVVVPGGFSNFQVTIKPNNQSSVLYYEDIVNMFYMQAINTESYSYAYYPYNTVLSYLYEGVNYIYFFVTDKPFLSDYMIAQNGDISIGNIVSQGISGECWVASFPVYSVPGTVVNFYNMSAYGNQSFSDVFGLLQAGLPIKQPNGSYMGQGYAAGVLGSFEGEQANFYTVCSNYSLTLSTYQNNASIKQAFRFSEMWALLVRVYNTSGSDSDSASLHQVLLEIRDSLRKDSTFTAYYMLEQIYNILADVNTLNPNDPMYQALTNQTAIDFIKNAPPANLAVIGSFAGQMNGVVSGLMFALGAFGTLFAVGITLGVVKVVLQR